MLSGGRAVLFGIFVILSAASLALFAYPYLIYPAILRKLPAVPIRTEPISKNASILFCAYNEAQSLPGKIDNLRGLKNRYPTLEILAFDDGSTDGTRSILAEAGDILTLVEGEGRAGKASGMKRLAGQADGEILIFTDANVILADDLLDQLLPYYVDEDVGGVCGTLIYGPQPESATAEVGAAYWKLDEKLRSLEAQTGNVMGADGSLFSVRRELYPSFPDSVLDDMTVSMGAVFAGKRLLKADNVFAYENSVSERKEELRRKIRIGARAFHTHLYLRPQLRNMRGIDRFKYVSRKIMRWFGGLFLLLATAFGVAAIAVLSPLAALAVTLSGAIFLLVIVLWPGGSLAKVGDALLAIFATQLGVYRGLKGETVATWSPAKSR